MCNALRDLAPFVQFKKREKHQWRSDTFATLGVFHLFKIVQMIPNREKRLV